MTTNAGRALLGYARALDARLTVEVMGGREYHGIEQVCDESIAAIEAEKEAEVRARIAEEVRGLRKRQTFLAPSEYEAAVLALIQPKETA